MKLLAVVLLFLLTGALAMLTLHSSGEAPVVTDLALREQGGGGQIPFAQGGRPDAEQGTEMLREFDSNAVDWSEPEPAGRPVMPWTLTVWVLDRKGAPVAGAEVRSLRGETESDLCTTGADGRVELACGGAGLWLIARKPGFGQSQARSVVPNDGEAEVAFVLNPEVVLRGKVVRADGSLVPHAAIRGDARAEAFENVPDVVKCEADANGEFECTVVFGKTYRLHAKAEGKQTATVRVDVNREALPPVRLSLADPSTISGIVLDASGEPAVDATVYARDESGGRSQAYTVHGKFRIELPTTGSYRLSAKTSREATVEKVAIETNEVRPHAQVTLRLQSLGEITGRVVDSQGRGLEDVTVSVTTQSDAESPYRKPSKVETAEDGAFSVRVPSSATCTLVAHKHGKDGVDQAVVRDVRAGDTDVELMFEAPGCVVSGTVTRPDGQPVDRCRVWIVDRSMLGTGLIHRTQETDARGRFTIPTQMFGPEFAVRVRGQGLEFAPQEIVVAPDGDEVELSFVLEPWGDVPVSVVDSTGAPAGASRVEYASQLHTWSRSWSVTPPHGRVTLRHCVPGMAKLCVKRPGSEAFEMDVEVAPGANNEIVVRLP